MLIRSKAPLRIGLAGGGTDVSPYSDIFGGAVLNATISMYAYATMTTEDSGVFNNSSGSLFVPVEFVFWAADKETKEVVTIKDLTPLCTEGVFNLHKGVINRLMQDYPEEFILALQKVKNVELATYVDAPAGSGLGTSSTLTVAIIGAFKEWLNIPLGEYETAQLAYKIERVDLGMAGGKQDQYAATFGGVNFMEFAADNRVIVNPLRIKQEYLNEMEFNTLLFHTGNNRVSAQIIAAQVENVQLNKQRSIEAMHCLKEQSILMKEAILKGQFYRIGEMLDAGWKHKKRTATEVTNPAIDLMYDTAIAAGATGGKISGAGGGGFMMLYCPGNTRYTVIEQLQRFGHEFRRYHFTESGLTTWKVEYENAYCDNFGGRLWNEARGFDQVGP